MGMEQARIEVGRMTSPTIQFDIPDDEDAEKPKTPDAVNVGSGSGKASRLASALAGAATNPTTAEGNPSA